MEIKVYPLIVKQNVTPTRKFLAKTSKMVYLDDDLLIEPRKPCSTIFKNLMCIKKGKPY